MTTRRRPNLGAHAKRYAAQGLRVFPVEPRGKLPLTEHGFKDATTDADQIESWWDQWPDANIGLPMGDGLFALDIDDREALGELPNLPPTVTALTGRPGGALHLIFATNGHALTNRRGTLPKGVDARGEGGYIVAPPSVHESGRSYCWVRGRGLGEIDFAPVPDALVERLQARRNGHAPAKKTKKNKPTRALRGLPEGERDDGLFRLASRLRWADIPRAVAEQLVLYAAAKCEPPFPQDEAVAKVASAYDRYEAGPSGSRTTDVANSRRLVALYGDDIRFVYPWRRWLVWDGERWRPDASGNIERLAKKTVRAIYLEAHAEEDNDERKRLASWAAQSESAGRIKAMIELARSERGVPVQPEELDADQMLMNVENGTINLRTGKLREHRRDDLLTKIAPVDFDAEAVAPLWAEFLETVLAGHADLIAFVQRAVGYSLTGDVSEQVLFILNGPGANGKSTLVEAVGYVLGDYAQSAAPGLLLTTRSDRHPTEMADLRGARLVYTVEVSEGRGLNEELVKKLTGGDTIKARRMRQDFTEFAPSHKLWLAVNHLPQIKGIDLAIWRRIRLIPFDVTISARERDRHLLDKLKGEAPGILAWAVRGCVDWRKRGKLGLSPQVREATREYREDSDLVGAFIDECCAIKQSARVSSSKLYARFCAWAKERGERPLTAKAFGTRLRAHGLESGRGTGGVRFWRGVRLAFEIDVERGSDR